MSFDRPTPNDCYDICVLVIVIVIGIICLVYL